MESAEVAKLEGKELAKWERKTERPRGGVTAKSDAALELGAFVGGGGEGTTMPGVTASASASASIYIDRESYANMLTALIVFVVLFGIMLTYQIGAILKCLISKKKHHSHQHHVGHEPATDEAVAVRG